MSIFQAETTAEGTPAAAANDLVGEGKKYKTVDDLAAGKLEADRTIKKREEELQAMRDELNRQIEINRAKEALEARGAPATPAVEKPEVKPQATDDVDARVEAILKRREAQSASQSNVDAVTKKMTELYGTTDKAAEVIATKAAELGMTPKALGEMAAANPKAFYRLIGVDGEVKKENIPPSSSWGGRNTQAFNKAQGQSTTKPGTYAWYQEMRKENPAQFFSARVQLQMDKDAREKKDAFYS